MKRFVMRLRLLMQMCAGMYASCRLTLLLPFTEFPYSSFLCMSLRIAARRLREEKTLV